MKRFLLSLMVFVMLMPGLACAQFMPQQKAPMMHMAKGMPCSPKSRELPCQMKFFKDCMKVDLQSAAHAPLIKKPDIAKFTPFIAPPAVLKNVPVNVNHAARGPPPSELAFEQHPLYLATLRLRI